MVLHLAERLEVPLRDRNLLLVAAGYAPVFPERALEDPALDAARKVIDLVLAGHAPYPALAVDRHWTIVAANKAVAPLLERIEASLLRAPVNALRLGLHPAGLAPRIANFAEWRAHLLTRLRRQIDLTADPVLVALLGELADYPTPAGGQSDRLHPSLEYADVVVPLKFVTDGEILSLFSMTTVFGTRVDITLSELAIESFLPADAATAEALHRRAAAA